jgi:hypothetical protein
MKCRINYLCHNSMPVCDYLATFRCILLLSSSGQKATLRTEFKRLRMNNGVFVDVDNSRTEAATFCQHG